MAKKESNQKNHYAREAWQRRKHDMNANPMAQQLQKIYRIDALRERAAEGCLTDKNRAEMERLGL